MFESNPPTTLMIMATHGIEMVLEKGLCISLMVMTFSIVCLIKFLFIGNHLNDRRRLNQNMNEMGVDAHIDICKR